jgi:hypothetical protein
MVRNVTELLVSFRTQSDTKSHKTKGCLGTHAKRELLAVFLAIFSASIFLSFCFSVSLSVCLRPSVSFCLCIPL